MSKKKLLWIDTSGFSGKLRSDIENAILSALRKLNSGVKLKKLQKRNEGFVSASIV